MGRYFDDELYHWKYKKRYRGKDGKWVYVYNDGSMSKMGSVSDTHTEVDPWGNIETYKYKTITNPNRWLSKKSISEKITTDSVTEDGHTHGRSKKTVTETIERGKLHMFKMDLERRISDIPKNFAQSLKEGSDWRKHAKKNNIKWSFTSFDDQQKYYKEYDKWLKGYRKKNYKKYD